MLWLSDSMNNAATGAPFLYFLFEYSVLFSKGYNLLLEICGDGESNKTLVKSFQD